MVLLKCRRSLIAIIAIACLTYLGARAGTTDVSASIAAIAMALAGANSFEKIKTTSTKTASLKSIEGDDNGK